MKKDILNEMVLIRMDSLTRSRITRAAHRMGHKSVSSYIRAVMQGQAVKDLNLKRW